MKAFTVLAVALVGASQAAALSDSLAASALHAKWSSFKAQHGKSYEHAEEDSVRKTNFLSNTQAIEEHNTRFHQGLETFTMGHNEFSDLTLEEIMSTKMGLVLPPNAEELKANASVHVPSAGYQLPANIDWRTWGGVNYVKNQGSCGSCYTFSAVGALETAHWRKYNYLFDFSEQQLLDCTGEYGNGGCSGGWMHTAYKWLLEKSKGVFAQSDYPYRGVVQNCRQAASGQSKTNVQTYSMVKSEDALMNVVGTTGAVAIAYNAGTQQHSYYTGGILDVPSCGNQPTHAVTLVGYGTENGVNFWTLKNSWGTGWGEKGFFRMVRGKNMCGIADWASYPLVV